jgi:hypothetical protein
MVLLFKYRSVLDWVGADLIWRRLSRDGWFWKVSHWLAADKFMSQLKVLLCMKPGLSAYLYTLILCGIASSIHVL